MSSIVLCLIWLDTKGNFNLETHKRTLARTISYRIVATLVTALITGLGTAIVIHILLTLIHYLMERIWLKINWGKIDQ
jgi:uncharacterized membrane protein